MYPWMYRQLLLDYFDTEENLKNVMIIRQVPELQKVPLFLRFLSRFLEAYSRWTSEITETSSESVSQTEFQNM